MFVVTLIFMVGLIFTVQQALFRYSELDLSAPFIEGDSYFIRNTIEVFNDTVRNSGSCAQAEVNLKELSYVLAEKSAERGFSANLVYDLNCSLWGNQPPQAAPVTLNMQIEGKGVTSSGTKYFYGA